jgi:hypothetical protein
MDCEACNSRRADISRAERAAQHVLEPQQPVATRRQQPGNRPIVQRGQLDADWLAPRRPLGLDEGQRRLLERVAEAEPDHLVHRRARFRVNGEPACQRLNQDARVRPRAGRHARELGAHPGLGAVDARGQRWCRKHPPNSIRSRVKLWSWRDTKSRRSSWQLRPAASYFSARELVIETVTATGAERTSRSASFRSQRNRSTTY